MRWRCARVGIGPAPGRSARSRRRTCVKTASALLATLGVLVLAPAAAFAGGKVIESAGPLNAIFLDEDLGCQLHAIGDTSLSFYGSPELGECGTFLADSERAELWGPASPAGVKPELDFVSVIPQLTGGVGTAQEPLTVVTHVGAYEPTGELVAELTEEDTYVVGEDSYTTTIEILNRLAVPLKGTIYHAGHCFLAGLYDSYGADDVPSTGSVACSIEPDDVPAARYMALTPVAISGSIGSPNEAEGEYEPMWATIDPDGSQFPDTFAPDTFAENAIGLSWPIDLSKYDESGDTAELRFTTTVSPWSPPVSSAGVSTGACVPSGQVPVTVSAVDGPAAVDFVLNGVAGSVPTNAAGQATILLPAGQNTLEYWGVDEAGDQEEAHHVLGLTVASGGPGLTISSDQGRASYNLNEAASVTIAASGPGLTSNPSASGVPISTTTPGTYSVTRSAADACGTTTASFTYMVASTPAPLPPPVLDQTVNVAPVSGTVLVALPTTGHASLAGALEGAFASASKGLKFVPLTQARQLPVGSTLEATGGKAMITTATATKGKTQSGEFGAGIFKLLQSRKQKGLTELNIIDNRSSKQVCASIGKNAQAAGKHLSGKTLGRLNSSGHGSFRTNGQESAATVRGTVWSVANQCDGTLTKVTRGEVSVRDFRRRKTITLFSGQSYLARAAG
jgi:hypothetical protein